MDLLVADGWLPSYNISAVLLQIRMAVSSTEPRPARLAQNWQTPYGVQEALDGLFYLFVSIFAIDTPPQDLCVLRTLMVGQFLTGPINWFYDDGVFRTSVLVPLSLFVHFCLQCLPFDLSARKWSVHVRPCFVLLVPQPPLQQLHIFVHLHTERL